MKSRTKRACQVCGKPFYGGIDCHYCPDCARIKKLDTVIRIRVCQDCGAKFCGAPKAKRCPDCSYKAQLKRDRDFKKSGPIRPLGSVDKCEICGKEYTVKSGRQKYCSDVCMRKGVLSWQREHKKGYNKESGQDIKKMERRKQAKKICVYCLRTFSSSTTSNLCSDYCRAEQRKLTQCIADLNRGYKRDLASYEKRRQEYRDKVNNV